MSATDIGTWTNIGNSGVVCVHAALIDNNNLLCIERPHTLSGIYPENPQTNGRTGSKIALNPSAEYSNWNVKYESIPVEKNAFCAGMAQMGNGSVAVIGGDDTDFTTSAGEFAGDGRFSVRVFSSDKWVEVKSMSSPRWYPSVTTLADGSLIIVGGATVAQPNYSIPRSYDNPTYEYYPAKPSTQARQFPLYLDLLSWSFPYNLYPSVFQTPSGHVFIFSSNKTIMLNPRDESITFLPDMPALDHRPWIYPFTPTSFILPMTKANNYAFTIMICGGTTNNDNYDASPLCLSISPNTANPIWTQTDPMPIPRVMPDSVLLPDGTVLITNGLQRGMAGGGYQGNCAAASIPIYQAVLYIPANPAGRRWKTLAAAQNKRLYHSGALLLESGHAVSFGSEMDNYDDYYGDPSVRDSCWPVAYTACKSPFNYNIEVFSPPYLSTSTGSSKRRSIVITQAPESVVYSSILSISFTNKSRVDRFSFVRRGSCTHQLNTDQRLIELEAAQLSCRIILDSADTTVCEASIPIWFSSGMAPPGSWFLFAIDGEGVPSVAKTIMLSQSGISPMRLLTSSAVKSHTLPGSRWSLLHIPGVMLFISAFTSLL